MTPEMQKFIELLEKELGYSEKSGGYTKFGDWYGSNVEFDADYTSAPWCDMYLSWAAKKLGYEDWIGQFAYTVYHAEWFRQQDAWGTTPKPGAIVFFDWSGSNQIKKIDHVGIVTKVQGRTIQTIEGNIDGGVAKRKERDTSKVVGYGYPEKIKARLDKKASEKQTIVNPSDVNTGNSVVLSMGPDLLAMIPAPDPAREAESSTKPSAKAAPKHAKTTSTETAKTADKAAGEEKTAQPAQKADENPAPAQASAGRIASPGKHAKPATADTSAFAVTPTAVTRDLGLHTSELSTPAVLAPVLLAAVAIIAHAKVKQSRVRLAFTTASERTAHAPTPRRTPGRRRAPGRRRMSRNVPVLVGERRSTQEIVLVSTPTPTPTPAPAPAPARTAEFPSVTMSIAHAGDTGRVHRSDDHPRLPYQGRRRLRERPVVESSTFVQNAPLRGRRHRRADSVVSTTISTGPTTPTIPTAPNSSRSSSRGSARSWAGPVSPAGSTNSTRPAVPLPAESGELTELADTLVHSGYQGRRRAKVPA